MLVITLENQVQLLAMYEVDCPDSKGVPLRRSARFPGSYSTCSCLLTRERYSDIRNRQLLQSCGFYQGRRGQTSQALPSVAPLTGGSDGVLSLESKVIVEKVTLGIGSHAIVNR